MRSGPLHCFVLDALLPPEECRAVIAMAEASGFGQSSLDYPASYRDNDRLVRDDPALAQSLLARIEPHLPALYRDAQGARWKRVGLNPRFRYCRYRDGQSFRIHRDGAYSPRPGVRSQLTVMLYLNDAANFAGGATRFWAGKSPESEFLGSVIPAEGRAVIFDHALWHDGEPVTAGTKYVLRTDVLYEREHDTRANPDRGSEAAEGHLLSAELRGHDGYVWSVIQRSGRFARLGLARRHHPPVVLAGRVRRARRGGRDALHGPPGPFRIGHRPRRGRAGTPVERLA